MKKLIKYLGALSAALAIDAAADVTITSQDKIDSKNVYSVQNTALMGVKDPLTDLDFQFGLDHVVDVDGAKAPVLMGAFKLSQTKSGLYVFGTETDGEANLEAKLIQEIGDNRIIVAGGTNGLFYTSLNYGNFGKDVSFGAGFKRDNLTQPEARVYAWDYIGKKVYVGDCLSTTTDNTFLIGQPEGKAPWMLRHKINLEQLGDVDSLNTSVLFLIGPPQPGFNWVDLAAEGILTVGKSYFANEAMNMTSPNRFIAGPRPIYFDGWSAGATYDKIGEVHKFGVEGSGNFSPNFFLGGSYSVDTEGVHMIKFPVGYKDKMFQVVIEPSIVLPERTFGGSLFLRGNF